MGRWPIVAWYRQAAVVAGLRLAALAPLAFDRVQEAHW
jgi:hypothetical protein